MRFVWVLLILMVGAGPSAQAERLSKSNYAGGGLFDEDDFEQASRPVTPMRPGVGPKIPAGPGTAAPATPAPPGATVKPLFPPSQGSRPSPPAKKPFDPRNPPGDLKQHVNKPIWVPFYTAFKNCEPDCEPVEVGIHRHDPGDGRQSCHYSDRAIDVHSMKCKGQSREIKAIQSSEYNGRFAKLVQCIRQTQRKHIPKVIWHSGGGGQTQNHEDHGHFSLTCYGGRFY